VSGYGCGQQPKHVTVFYSLHMCNVSVASLVLYDFCGFINVGDGVCASVVNAGNDVLIFLFIYRGFGGALGRSTKCGFGLRSVCSFVTRVFCFAGNKGLRVKQTLIRSYCWSVRRYSEPGLIFRYISV
jgi:hypothetical protein